MFTGRAGNSNPGIKNRGHGNVRMSRFQVELCGSDRVRVHLDSDRISPLNSFLKLRSECLNISGTSA
jgi:hypothetical protein